jgi:hypothetical protein
MGPESLMSKAAIERITGAGFSGMRHLLAGQISSTREALSQLERTAELFES